MKWKMVKKQEADGRDHEEVAVLGIFEVILHLLLTNEDNKERMYNIAMKDNLISTPIHL